MAKTKIDIWKFTGQGNIYCPNYDYILYEKGFNVATNGRVLIKMKTEYEVFKEGLILDKRGDVVDTKFPPYESLLSGIHRPDITEISLSADVLDRLKAYSKEWKKQFKSTRNWSDIYIDGTAYLMRDFVRLVPLLENGWKIGIIKPFSFMGGNVVLWNDDDIAVMTRDSHYRTEEPKPGVHTLGFRYDDIREFEEPTLTGEEK